MAYEKRIHCFGNQNSANTHLVVAHAVAVRVLPLRGVEWEGVVGIVHLVAIVVSVGVVAEAIIVLRNYIELQSIEIVVTIVA